MANQLEATAARIESLVLVEHPDALARGSGHRFSPLPAATPGIALDPADGDLALYFTEEIETGFPADVCVPSWNVVGGDHVRFDFDLRVGCDGDWSPWFRVGRWGPGAPSEGVPSDGVVEDSAWGEVDIDFLWTCRTFNRVQLRAGVAKVAEPSSSASARPFLRRFAAAISGPAPAAAGAGPPAVPPASDEALWNRRLAVPPEPYEALWNRRLAVPFRSQRWEHPDIAWSVCSPTSVAMVLAGYGIDVPTAEVLATAYDPDHGIYGNWGRAVQTAYEYGVPGWLERFGSWDAVRRRIAEGRPVVASIRAGKDELPGAPYSQSAGHLLVITGFDGPDRVCVNDPAAAEAEEGVTTYPAAAMETVWLNRSRVGYVFASPEPRPGDGRGEDSK